MIFFRFYVFYFFFVFMFYIVLVYLVEFGRSVQERHVRLLCPVSPQRLHLPEPAGRPRPRFFGSVVDTDSLRRVFLFLFLEPFGRPGPFFFCSGSETNSWTLSISLECFKLPDIIWFSVLKVFECFCKYLFALI